MLNYANLNDVEFESLCRDIMERMLGVPLRRFAPGRDGGVDLTDDTNEKNIIVQVKHYQSSSTAALVSSLKNELPKVDQLQPKEYYICCSRLLSAENINTLYQHFRAYMESDQQIITLLEIDDFLKKGANKDILQKHFKLWLDDTGILQDLGNNDIFVDCESFLDDAEALHKLFVRTKAFDRALASLKNDQTLCIIGDPGVGKSITSKMLVLFYASQNYRVRYTSNVSDLGSLKASLRRDSESKEVILLDDCFGQAYFEMKSTQTSELISLIKYVKRRPNKVLILNSRVTIFQEARQRQRDLIHCLEREDFKVHVLDINNLSEEEKAKILYNHLAFSGIPSNYYEEIRIQQRYRSIINHRNFNPRIIEFVCNPKRYKSISPEKFFDFILKHLDNPKEMWKDEYDDHLQPADRILLQTVYSLTTNTVNAKLVRLCFERRIASIPTIDKTIDQFNRSLERLTKGFIRILDKRGTREISMQNPSVNDFLDGRLLHNSAERADLLSSMCTVNQLRLLPESERIPYIVNLLQNGKVDQLIFINQYDKSAVIGHCILASHLCIDKYCQELYNYIAQYPHLSSTYNVSLLGRINIRQHILAPEIWDFYNLKSFFEESDHLYHFLSMWGLSGGVSFINSIDNYFHGNTRILYTSQVDKYISEAISEFCCVDATDYESDLDVESAIHLATSDEFDIDEEDAAATLDECVQAAAFEELQSIISELPQNFRHLADHIQEEDILVDGSDQLIQEYLSDPPGHSDPDDDEKTDIPPYSPIDAIFQR